MISRIRLRHLSPPPTSISKYLSPTLLYPLIPETPVFPSELQLRSRTRERPAELELLPSSRLLIFVFWSARTQTVPDIKPYKIKSSFFSATSTIPDASEQLALSQLQPHRSPAANIILRVAMHTVLAAGYLVDPQILGRRKHPVLILQHMIKLAISDFPTPRHFCNCSKTTSQIPESSLLYISTQIKLVNTPQQLQAADAAFHNVKTAPDPHEILAQKRYLHKKKFEISPAPKTGSYYKIP